MSAGVWQLHSLGWVERLAHYTAKVNPTRRFLILSSLVERARVDMGCRLDVIPQESPECPYPISHLLPALLPALPDSPRINRQSRP